MGCRTEPQRPVRPVSKVRIALVGRARTDETWPVLASLAARFSRYEDKMHVELAAPETASPSEQKAIVESLSPGQCDVVCVHPVDPGSIQLAIDDAVRKGLPVVTLGRDVPSSGRVAYCGPTDYELGKAAAGAVRFLTTGRSNSIMLLHGGTSEELAGARYAGFKQALPLTPGIRLLKEVDCQAHPRRAAELVRAETQRYPRLAGWVFLDDWPLRNLSTSERLLPEGCGTVLCGADPYYYEHLEHGLIQAMLGYDYHRAAEAALYAALRVAQDAARGQAQETNIPTVHVTRGDLPRWRSLWKEWARGPSSAPVE